MKKTAVVTGASRGIGGKIVENLLARGWDVWGLDLDGPEKPFNVPAGQRYTHIACNVSDPAALKAAFDRVRADTDALGAVVCSAGVTLVGELDEISIEDVDLMYRVNLRAPWLTVREALPQLLNGASTADPSRVVIIGSAGGLRPKVGNGFYSALKQAVHTISNIFAVELGPKGITFNSIAPGTVDTRMPREAAKAAAAKGSSAFAPSGVSPMGRIAGTQDVAEAAMFFLSDGAKYINGTVLPVDGGGRAAYRSYSRVFDDEK